MLSRLLNLLFPPQCLNCDMRVPVHGTLCLTCWQSIKFISDPLCACCGLPFDYDIGDNALCAACLHTRPIYSRARAAFSYDEHSRRLVTRLKYSDQTQLARIYGAWLAKAGNDLLTGTDIIIPVPLHYWRFVRRRFNQSALLAQSLAKTSGIRNLPGALRRTRSTQPQTGLSSKQRSMNVKGAFAMNRRHAQSIKGKNILLVDDVMTTGSTIEQCSKALLDAGATRVNVITLARAIK